MTSTRRRQPVGYKPRIWTRDDRVQVQQVARAALEPGTAELRVRRADHSATLPPVCRLSLLASYSPEINDNFEHLYVYLQKHVTKNPLYANLFSLKFEKGSYFQIFLK